MKIYLSIILLTLLSSPVQSHTEMLKHTEAVKWHRKAANLSFIDPQLSSRRLGVPRNDAEAVKWHGKAADQDYGLSLVANDRRIFENYKPDSR